MEDYPLKRYLKSAKPSALEYASTRKNAPSQTCYPALGASQSTIIPNLNLNAMKTNNFALHRNGGEGRKRRKACVLYLREGVNRGHSCAAHRSLLSQTVQQLHRNANLSHRWGPHNIHGSKWVLASFTWKTFTGARFQTNVRMFPD